MNPVFSDHLDRLGECECTPLVVGEQVLISCDFFASHVQLQGDFDEWGPGVSMQEKKGVWWAIVNIDPTCSFSYKFLVDDVWFCDPNNPYISFGPEAHNSCIPIHGKGGIVSLDVYSPELENNREVFVYVPYAAQNGKYCPVLYAQDGCNIFTNPQAPFGHWALDQTLDRLIDAGLIPPILVVGIDTKDRMNEYSWCSFAHETQIVPRLDSYTNFVMHTLHPLIEKRWRCNGDKGILGGSLGGSSAFWMAWHHSEFFSRVASFSGSFWMKDPAMEEIVRSASIYPKVRMYLDAGDTNSEGVRHIFADNLKYVDALHAVLCSSGYVSSSPKHVDLEQENLIVWDEERIVPSFDLCMIVGVGHQHREEDWAKRVGWALRFLYADVLEDYDGEG